MEKIVNSDLIRIISKAPVCEPEGTRQLRKRLMPDIATVVKNRTDSESPQLEEHFFKQSLNGCLKLKTKQSDLHLSSLMIRQISRQKSRKRQCLHEQMIRKLFSSCAIMMEKRYLRLPKKSIGIKMLCKAF